MGETHETEALWECPGEAHELDNTFNPCIQGPYGPGYHYCYVCNNECYVTYDVYIEELEWQAGADERYRKHSIQRKQEADERKLIDTIMSLPKANVPM